MRASEMQNRELNLQIGDVRGRDSVVDHHLELRYDSGDEIADFGPSGGETALNLGTLVCIGHPSVGGKLKNGASSSVGRFWRGRNSNQS